MVGFYTWCFLDSLLVSLQHVVAIDQRFRYQEYQNYELRKRDEHIRLLTVLCMTS